MSIKGIINYIKNPRKLFEKLEQIGWLAWLSDEKYLKAVYKIRMGKVLNLKTPSSFNEKLQYLKIHDHNPKYHILADKYLVREYISEKLGKDYLIPLIGVWDNPNEIDFESLPNQFVLKCNHNSGLGMCICKNKSIINKDEIRKNLIRGIREDYYRNGREWPYKDIPRKIIAEQYMEDSASGELRDYKFFCFNGRARFFKVDFDRFTDHHANYYDIGGTLLYFGETVCPPNVEKKIELPNSIPKMVFLAEKLAEGIPFVRVDFYDVNGSIYFGEMTFFPASGMGTFIPEEADEKIGELLDINALVH